MDPWSRQALTEILELTRENNKMLKKVRGVQRMAFFTQVIYIIVILGLPLAALYYFKPYLNNLLGAYGDSTNVIDSIPKLPSAENLNSIKELLK